MNASPISMSALAVFAMLGLEGAIAFALVYFAARLAIRYERRREIRRL